MEQKVFIHYKQDTVLADAFSVTLASEDGSYGIKQLDGTIIVPDGTTANNPSTGVYEYVFTALPNVIYTVSWRVVPNSGDQPKYVTKDIGPFEDVSTGIRAVADKRGTFVQGTKSVIFMMLTDLDGNAKNASLITYQIESTDGSILPQSGVPERCADGFYAVDWQIDQSSVPAGTYNVLWEFTVDGELGSELQEVVVATQTPQLNYLNLYAGRVLDFRMQLNFLLRSAQNIPVYNEPSKQTTDYRTYRFTFPRWNQSAGVRIMRNDIPVTEGFTVDYFKGEVAFDNFLTRYDRVTAYYNFRWFTDEELDRFMSNGLHIMNYYPQSTQYNLMDLPDNFIPIVLWGAAIEALRHLMLDITFQEPALVFGDQNGIDKAFQRFEATKKNYEEYWAKALDTKKFARNYVGLTRTVVVPEYTLPGGRSRWFRYLFTSS